MKFTESDITSKAFDEIYNGKSVITNDSNVLQNTLLNIEKTSHRWTANHLELPEVPSNVSRYKPENHTTEFQNEYTRICKIIRTCLIDELYKRLGNSFDEERSMYVCANRYSDRNNVNNIIPDVYNHRKQIINLEIENKLMSDKIVKLEECLSEISTTFKKYDERFAYHENQINFLTVRNKFLEDTLVIYKSPYVITIQRYWRKYKLLKRIKEASNIYRLTKNFTNFVNPINMLHSRESKSKMKYH